MFLGLCLGLGDVLMEELVGVTACVLGDMGCLCFRLRVWDTLKEEDKGWSEKKMVELDFLKLEFYVEILFHIECHCLGLRLGLEF